MQRIFTYVLILMIVVIGMSCQQAQVPAEIKKEVIGDRLPALPFSDVVKVGNTYYFSGKVGTDPATGKLAEGGIEAETKAIMEAFGSQLSDLGMDFSNLVLGTVYLTDIEFYQGMNNVYKTYFPSGPPARACVAVKDLVLGAKIEIVFIGVK